LASALTLFVIPLGLVRSFHFSQKPADAAGGLPIINIHVPLTAAPPA
jgi:hypothetical protein